MTETDSPALPTSLAVDDYMPAALRDVLAEADGCVQSGFLTGGTACARHAVDMLLASASRDGGSYEDRVHALHGTRGVPQMLTTILVQLGEASARDGTKFSTNVLRLFLATIKAIVYELYVLGPERAERLRYIRRLVDAVQRKPSPEDAGYAAVTAGDFGDSIQTRTVADE